MCTNPVRSSVSWPVKPFRARPASVAAASDPTWSPGSPSSLRTIAKLHRWSHAPPTCVDRLACLGIVVCCNGHPRPSRLAVANGRLAVAASLIIVASIGVASLPVRANHRVHERTTDLVQRLQVARRELTLESAIRKHDEYHLLILDDIAYVRKDQAETSALFELVSSRYERRSMLINRQPAVRRVVSIFPRLGHDLRRRRPVRAPRHHLRTQRRELSPARRRLGDLGQTRPRPGRRPGDSRQHRGDPAPAPASKTKPVEDHAIRRLPMARSPPARVGPAAATSSHPDCRGFLILIDALRTASLQVGQEVADVHTSPGMYNSSALLIAADQALARWNCCAAAARSCGRTRAILVLIVAVSGIVLD